MLLFDFLKSDGVQKILNMMNDIVGIIRWVVPIGLIIMTSIDILRKVINPLEKDDPDINLSLEERKEGGLGIYIVKQLMDKVSYRYSDLGENILTIEKKVGE